MKYIPQPRTQTCYEITIYCYLPRHHVWF